jgi:hypothetical protein
VEPKLAKFEQQTAKGRTEMDPKVEQQANAALAKWASLATTADEAHTNVPLHAKSMPSAARASPARGVRLPHGADFGLA